MSIQITVTREMNCNGRTGCLNKIMVEHSSNKKFRKDAEVFDWHSNPQSDYDLCPKCSYKFLNN